MDEAELRDPPPRRARPLRVDRRGGRGRAYAWGLLLLAASVTLLGVLLASRRIDETDVGRGLGTVPGRLVVDPAAATDPGIEPYRGLGTWVDAFDFAPAYQSDGRSPSVVPADTARMAGHGVETLYLQVARNDERSPDRIVDRGLVASTLLRAHQDGMAVVAWYLPKFGDVATDLEHLVAMAEFDVLGHRFDGIAVDIEWTGDVDDHAERSARLVDLSRRLRSAVGNAPLGAIVLPPVQIEVVNPAFWPGFPWRELEPLYDVWLPMSYWTFRSAASGYQDGFTYNAESTERLRANLGDPDAPVHGIGGIGDLVTTEQLDAFVLSLTDTGSIGGSIYDWDTLSDAHRAHLGTATADR